MNYTKFLEQVIDKGIEAAKRDYSRPEQKDKLEGSIKGFEACRGKQPQELLELLVSARKETHKAFVNKVTNYWYIRCQEGEIEWVCNCVSAMAMNQGLLTIIPPTCRAALTVAEIIGVQGESA